MKTLTKENLLEFLVKHKARQPILDWAQSQDSARNIVEKCPKVQHLNWLIGAIDGPMLAEYNKKQVQLWVEYDKKQAPFWTEYYKKEDTIMAEYNKQVAPLRAEYNEKVAILIRSICTFEKAQEVILSQLNQPKE